MKLTGKFIINNVFRSDKGSSYLDLVDLETGGLCKLALQGEVQDNVKLTPVKIEAEVKPSIYNGKLNLNVQGSQIKFTTA